MSFRMSVGRRMAARCAAVCALWGVVPAGPAGAQVIETAGTRALGMGGAFVAVANDSSATWWNPAGLAGGPFADLTLARTSTQQERQLPGWRSTTSWFAISTPPLGVSYYRQRLVGAGALEPAPSDSAGAAASPVQSMPLGQLGVTVVQTIVSGVHAAATVKYLHGTSRSAWEVVPDAGPGQEVPAAGVDALLRRAQDLQDGGTTHRLDLDAGLLALRGPLRAGVVVRNATQPTFGTGMALPRQIRAGVAFDADEVGTLPLLVSLDVDVRAYATLTGPRQVVAAGAEHWLLDRRIGLRGGARFNTTGAHERTGTGGASYALRRGLYVEGYAARGGSPGEQGWGLGARATF